MENSRKQLKIASIVVLVFWLISLVNLISALFFGDLNEAAVPDGSPENTLMITRIFVLSLSAIMLLPQLYVGIKGLRVAANPDNSKAHIFWAVILFIVALSNLIPPILAAIRGESVSDNVLEAFSAVVDVIVYFDFIVYARAVLKGN